MKHLARILSLLILVSASLFYMSCDGGDDDKKSEEETQLGKLSSTWTISKAELDDEDRTTSFSNLKLTLSGTYTEDGASYDYSFTGTRPNPSPWPASGTWKFGSPATSQIIRLFDNMPIAYTVSDNQLTLTFDCTTCDFAGSRGKKVNGTWEFIFTK